MASIRSGDLLLDQGRVRLQEVRDDGLTGFDRLQYLLTAALVDNFLGQVRLGQHDYDGAARLFADGLAEGAPRTGRDRPARLALRPGAGRAGPERPDRRGGTHLKEGLALAARTGDEPSAGYYLEAMAGVAGQRDEPERAVRLIAAARSLAGGQGQRLAARVRAARPARRGRPGRVAVPARRRGVRGGPGVGQVRREQARRGVRAGVRRPQPTGRGRRGRPGCGGRTR